MKDLRPIRGKYYIADLISQGEHERQDFKYAINDALKIARSLSAFANNAGGRLLIGVKDNGRIAGVRNDEDIYVVEQAAEMYCRPAQSIRFKAFAADGGTVITAEIDPAPHRPVQAREPDGRWRAYYRVADENIVASPLMVRAWRLAEQNGGTVLSVSEAESRLLSVLRAEEAADVETLMVKCRLSRAATEDIIVRLAALDIVGFTHTPHGFKACLK